MPKSKKRRLPRWETDVEWSMWEFKVFRPTPYDVICENYLIYMVNGQLGPIPKELLQVLGKIRQALESSPRFVQTDSEEDTWAIVDWLKDDDSSESEEPTTQARKLKGHVQDGPASCS